jgi:hypothetical protein
LNPNGRATRGSVLPVLKPGRENVPVRRFGNSCIHHSRVRNGDETNDSDEDKRTSGWSTADAMARRSPSPNRPFMPLVRVRRVGRGTNKKIPPVTHKDSEDTGCAAVSQLHSSPAGLKNWPSRRAPFIEVQVASLQETRPRRAWPLGRLRHDRTPAPRPPRAGTERSGRRGARWGCLGN